MDLPTILEHTPVAASILLVIVGGFILFEIYRMVSPKLPKKEEKKPSDSIENLAPLKFPQVTGQRIKKTVSRTAPLISKKFFITLLIIAMVVSFLGGGVYYIQSSGISWNSILDQISRMPFIPESALPKQIPTPPVRQYNSRILLFQETIENQWVPLEESDLSTLHSGDIIRIVVAVDEEVDRIEIYVNDNLIPLSSNSTPEGYQYARFIIPRSESQYHVAARIY